MYYFLYLLQTGSEISTAVIRMDSKKAHDLLEHCNQKATRETAVELG